MNNAVVAILLDPYWIPVLSLRTLTCEKESFWNAKFQCWQAPLLFLVSYWQLGKWQVLPVPPSHLCKIMAVFRTNNPVFPIAFMQKSVYQKHNLKRMIQSWSRSWPEKITQVPTPLSLTGVAIDDTFLITGLALHFRHYLSFVIFLNCQFIKLYFGYTLTNCLLPSFCEGQ